MSLEQLKAFLAKVNEDSSLQEKLKAAKSPEDVVSIAKEHGHDFALEHINQLTDKELEGVSGGTAIITPIIAATNAASNALRAAGQSCG